MRTLADKLGLPPGGAARVLGAPDGLAETLAALPPAEGDAPPALVLAFARDRAGLAAIAPRALSLYARGGRLWLAYPKKSGALSTDLSRDVGWEPLTGAGMLPVAQVAVDETWSALRFRRRDEIAKITRKSA